jgi:hypothetical protein
MLRIMLIKICEQGSFSLSGEKGAKCPRFSDEPGDPLSELAYNMTRTIPLMLIVL